MRNTSARRTGNFPTYQESTWATLFSILIVFSYSTALAQTAGTATSEVSPSFSAPRQQARRPRPNPAPGPVTLRVPGAPLEGLSPTELNDFTSGFEEFQNVETAESGLGPIFNNVSCVACHSAPATGGSSAITVTRFGRSVGGNFDPLSNLGGSLLQQSAIDPAALEHVPSVANVVAQRQSTPLFGLGLIEAIPDSTIQLNAARPKGDGVTGRVAWITDVASGQTRAGRFGWKAQQAALLSFAGDAYLNEMGITNRFFPQENAPNGDAALLAQYDNIADPEDTVDPTTGESDIDKAADFMRLLAPLPPIPPTRQSSQGGAVFQRIGCANCHQPSMTTGFSSIRALSSKNVPLYSDLLLHDMGSLGDGIAQGAAGPREMKTAPLWGVRESGPYLHDGRAPTLDAAIRAHDGEGAISRDRYIRLHPTERQQLLAFLNSI